RTGRAAPCWSTSTRWSGTPPADGSPPTAPRSVSSGAVSLQTDLLEWAERSRRDLPWRRTRDPWAVLVSELMLQQTQVSRVASRWADFLERFPTASECAAASVGDVVRAWEGLGYNRRAVSLHRMAVTVVER